MTELERGYLAGIIDGEGSITLTKDKQFRYPVLEVSSTTYQIVEYLKEHFGGVISKKNERNPKWKQAYIWKIERGERLFLYQKRLSVILMNQRKKLELS